MKKKPYFLLLLVLWLAGSSCSFDFLSPDKIPDGSGESVSFARNGENVAEGKTVTSSSFFSVPFLPGYAVDGDVNTCWVSATGSDPEWLCLDLGRQKDVVEVVIKWHGSYYAIRYSLGISEDGITWTTVATDNAGDGGADTIPVGQTCRYIRVNCLLRNDVSFGINEWEVYSERQYRIAVVDCYAYRDEQMNVRMIETDSGEDYTTEPAGVLYFADSCQGVQGGFWEDGNLFFGHDDPDDEDTDYLVKVDTEGTVLQRIDLGTEIAPQEMIRAGDGCIYLAYQDHWLTTGGLKKIDDTIPSVVDYTTDGVGAHYMSAAGGKIYLSHYGDWGASYAGARVDIYDQADMTPDSTISLNTTLSPLCQNTRNVCLFGTDLYIACYDNYFDSGAVVKADSTLTTSAIDLSDFSPVRIIATDNHVYLGAESDSHWDNIIDSVFEVDTVTDTVDETSEVNTSGYHIFDLKTFDNKIFATAIRNSHHYVLVADESFNLEEEIEIYTNVEYPLLLAVESYY